MSDTGMTDTRTPMGPNVRRFVRSAWLLLIAQLIATGIALGATGWAAFYVADLRAERDALRSQLEELTAGQPGYDEATAEDIAVIDPAPAGEDAVIDPVPPPAPATPTPRRPVTIPPPVTATPRTPQTRAPETRSPAPEPQRPPRRNTTYPGGLPGQGGNSEPPYVARVPGRNDGGRVRVPNVNVDPGVAFPRGPRRDSMPPQRDPTPPQRDPATPPQNGIAPAPRGPNDPVT